MTPLVLAAILSVISAAAGVWYIRRRAVKSAASMRERYPEAKAVVRGALFYGQQSRGVTQMRGNGTLVVTDSEIIFERWIPKAEYRIRLQDITGVDTPKHFLGKTNGRPVLRVTFTGVTGESDAMAWLVNDLASLKSLIESLRP